MKKNQPSSPSVASIVAELEKRQKQSRAKPTNSKVAQNDQKPPLPKRPENAAHTKGSSQKVSHGNDKTQSNTAPQTSPTAQAKMPPQRPPRARDKELSNTARKEGSTAQAKMPPPKPPRTKDREQSNTAPQTSPTAQAKMSPPKPPRTKNREQSNTAPQTSPTAQVRVSPQRPPRAKDKELGNTARKEGPTAQVRRAPPKPPRLGAERKQTELEDPIYDIPVSQKSLRLGAERKQTEQEDPIYDIPVSQKSLRLGAERKQTEQEDPIYDIPAPQKSLRTINKRQNNAPAREREVVYATLAPQETKHLREREQSNLSTQENKTIYAAIAPQNRSRSKENITNTMRRDILLEAYEEEIRYWSYIVYGDRLILQERMDEVRQKPTMGEQFSWKVATHPTSIANFAGRKVLGIKNEARKQAETSLSSLCSAINGYIYAIKYIQKDSVSLPQTEQRRHQQGTEQKAENLQSPPIVEKDSMPLSKEEIANRVQRDPSVLYSQEEVCYWSSLVYGDRLILQKKLEELQENPAMGEQFAKEIATQPKSISKLAGKQVLGLKTSARKQAEASLLNLADALKDYRETVQQVKESIIEEHQIQQISSVSSRRINENLHRQQSLSQPPQSAERTPQNMRSETPEASMQAEWNRQGARPRTKTITKSHSTPQETGSILPPPHTQQKRHEQQTEQRQTAENPPKQPHQEKKSIALSNKEIADRVQKDLLVQYHRIEVQYWTNIVYGDSFLLQERTQEVQKSPHIGQELSRHLALHPTFFAPLAGKKILGLKNSARKQAEASLPSLCAAIDDYASAVAQVQTYVLETQQKQHEQSSQLDQNLPKQQSVSKSPQVPESLTKSLPQESTPPPMQAEQRPQNIRSGPVTTPQKPALQQTTKRAPQSSHTQQKHHEQKTQRRQTAKNLSKPVTSEKESPSLSHKEIANRVQRDPAVQHGQATIAYWCKIVYDKPLLLQYNTEDIQKIPLLGEELSWQVANTPTFFSPLAGKQVLGIKNNTRKQAEEALPSLCSAINEYTQTVKQIRKNIVKHYQEQTSKLDESSQKQQSLSQSSSPPERASTTKHKEVAKTSVQEEQSLPSARARKTATQKTMSFVLQFCVLERSAYHTAVIQYNQRIRLHKNASRQRKIHPVSHKQ